ncbi:MAG: hypothetical protein INQ03_00675 [Candidatus Heimdallarchaeota archaeon]|nr:hypothetical protein [Candidatus Heimdallarchaeota archaeon]
MSISLLGIPGIRHQDLAYLLDVLDSSYLASVLLGETEFEYDLLRLKDLKYLDALAERENNINLIALIDRIEPIKVIKQSIKMRILHIQDYRQNSMKLLLWDDKPNLVDSLELEQGELLYIQGANTRMTTELILNCGSRSRIQRAPPQMRFSSIKQNKIESITSDTFTGIILSNPTVMKVKGQDMMKFNLMSQRGEEYQVISLKPELNQIINDLIPGLALILQNINTKEKNIFVTKKSSFSFY